MKSFPERVDHWLPNIQSFYLCGMNAKDIYAGDYSVYEGRLEYNRSKTEGKRKDNAFISIKIPPEAVDLLKKAGA